MSALENVICRRLRIAPSTAKELAVRLGMPVAFVRNTLTTLVFREKIVTCDKQGRYSLGDPKLLLELT